MTEHAPKQEHLGNSEDRVEHRPAAETRKSTAEHGHNEKPLNVGEIRHHVEAITSSKDEMRAAAEKAKPHQAKDEYASNEVRELVYQRTMLKIRRHLSPVARTTSKIIHQKAVEAVSEAAGKTVARPSGLLGGGLVAFVGTGIYYYMTRHYGYTYRSSVFLLLLVVGFIVGWLAEGAFKGFKSSK